jgi:hypothetical protein
MTSTLSRGGLAGVVGTLALNAATCLDMAMSGRSASERPGRTVLVLAEDAVALGLLAAAVSSRRGR